MLKLVKAKVQASQLGVDNANIVELPNEAWEDIGGDTPSVDTPIYLTNNGKTLVVTPEFPFTKYDWETDQQSTVYVPQNVSITNLKDVSMDNVINIDENGNTLMYSYSNQQNMTQPSRVWQSATHVYNGVSYSTGNADSFVVNNFLNDFAYVYASYSRLMSRAWTMKVSLTAGKDYMLNGGWSMNVWTAQSSRSQASVYPRTKVFIHTAPAIQDGNILYESNWADCSYNCFYKTNENTLSLSNSFYDSLFECPESGYVYMTMIVDLNGYSYTLRDTVSISSSLFEIVYGVDCPIDTFASENWQNPEVTNYQIMVSQYGQSNYTLAVAKDGTGTLKDPEGNVIPIV